MIVEPEHSSIKTSPTSSELPIFTLGVSKEEVVTDRVLAISVVHTPSVATAENTRSEFIPLTTLVVPLAPKEVLLPEIVWNHSYSAVKDGLATFKVTSPLSQTSCAEVEVEVGVSWNCIVSASGAAEVVSVAEDAEDVQLPEVALTV